MGLADRDWYQDEFDRREYRNSRAYLSRELSGSSILASLLLAAILVLLGFHAHSWWKDRERTRFDEPARVILKSDEPPDEARSQEVGRVEVPVPTQHVFKCIVDGRVIYEGPSDCRGALTTVAIEPPPAEPISGLSAYQREMLRSADARIAQQRALETAQRIEVRQHPASNQGECAALEQQIQSLDRRARSPLSAYEQDALRSARTTARLRQFALRC